MKKIFKNLQVLLVFTTISICSFAQMNNGGNIDYINQQSTTGKFRPQNVSKGIVQTSKNNVIINGVPSYNWQHGCGPTALGMVIGFYDNNGYPGLIEGFASTQTNEVNNAIANDQHYNDYALPIDSYPTLLEDNSELGGAHDDNCIADYMQTSWSSVGNYYGWSWNNKIAVAFIGFVEQQYPDLNPTTSYQYFSTSAWDDYTDQIDNNKPVVILVDTDGDGYTDHFVTGIGYNETNSTYGIYDTWDNDIHWYQWQGISNGIEWGVYGFTMFEFGGIPSSVDIEPYTPDNVDYTWDDKIIIKNSTVDDGYQDMHDDAITDADDVFISLSYWNNSDATITTPFSTSIFIDEVEQFTVNQTQDLNAHYYWMWWNNPILSNLSAGLHVIKMVVDVNDEVSEFNESNNVYSKYFTVSQNSSLTDAKNTNIFIYPNPTVDKIHVVSDFSLNEAIIEIYTITGQLIGNKTLNDDEIDVSCLSKGVYVIKINSVDVNFVQTFIKQ